MKFDVGDTVLLLHSGEEGVIMEILDEEMVSVNVNGIVFPAYIDQLDFPYFKRFTEGKKSPQKPRPRKGEDIPAEKPNKMPRQETGVFLSFLPEFSQPPLEWEVHLFKIHLINDTQTDLQFHYKLLLNGSLEMELKKNIHPFSHIYLHDLPFEFFNDRPRFSFVFSLTEPDKNKTAHHEIVFKPKPKQFIRNLEDLKTSQQATFRYLLFEKYPDKPVDGDWHLMLPGKPPVTGFVSPAHFVTYALPQYEIDLHIEKLVDHPDRFDATGMLAIQLGEFEKLLDRAIARRQDSLVAIHGVGKGRLRDEIHEILRRTPEVNYFVNQYNARYGYGATEIFFSYAD